MIGNQKSREKALREAEKLCIALGASPENLEVRDQHHHCEVDMRENSSYKKLVIHMRKVSSHISG